MVRVFKRKINEVGEEKLIKITQLNATIKPLKSTSTKPVNLPRVLVLTSKKSGTGVSL